VGNPGRKRRMVNIAPGRVLAASSIIKLIAKEAVLPVKEKMQQGPAGSKNPYPAAQRRVYRFVCEFRRSSDYCTFLAGAASPVLIIVAVFV
jgi:hypothetical protein